MPPLCTDRVLQLAVYSRQYTAVQQLVPCCRGRNLEEQSIRKHHP